MRLTSLSVLTIPLLLGALLTVAPPRGEGPSDAAYARWRDYVLPKGAELRYRQVPWRTSFRAAVVEAQEKDMPVLLWAMNGHPLCNT